jgi:ATP-binding cassette subfamily C protein
MNTPPSPQKASTRQTPQQATLLLCRRLLDMGAWRVGRVLALNTLAGLAEGVGVLAMVPVLTLMGIGESGAPLDSGRLLIALVGYVGLVAAAALVIRARGVALHALTFDVLDRLRGDLHAAVLAMEWSRFRTLRSAELQQTLTGEATRVAVAVTVLGGLAGAVFSLPFVLGASLLLSWPLTLAALAVAGLVILGTRHLGGAAFRLGRELGSANRSVAADLADDLAGMRVIKSFGAEAIRQNGIAARFAAVRENQFAQGCAQANERVALQIVAAAAAAGALYLAMVVLQVPLADTLVLVLAYGRLLQTALRVLSGWRQLSGAVAALVSYDETLAACRAAAEPAAAPGTIAPELRRAIQLCGVSVAYGQGETARAGLNGVNATLSAGRITAVIGQSGAGKSTLADLIAGLTTPDRGEIRIDDVVLTADLRKAWRRRVAVVPQDPFLFHDTIAANLRLASPDASESELWAALDTAAADFVRHLPAGLNTVVGDRGAQLSGGERQRIVLARALLRHPTLLVLDEATASLDSETETAVAHALARLHGVCTMVVVAHRPSTVRAADEVILLEDGELAAAGAWDHVRAITGARLSTLGF